MVLSIPVIFLRRGVPAADFAGTLASSLTLYVRYILLSRLILFNKLFCEHRKMFIQKSKLERRMGF